MMPDSDYEACGDMQMRQKLMPMLVVYDNPDDFAGKTVVRRTDMHMGSATVTVWKPQVVFDTLLEARFWIRRTYPHLSCIARAEQDAPHIVETWL
jgi:hypothetical protein